MPKVAFILAGCGYLDGAEIQEATYSLLALDKAGVSYDAFAPDVEQFHVVDHSTGDVVSESRNVLSESARIVRGKIQELGALDIAQYDALYFPGGFGVAKNLCTFAVDGPDCQVLPSIATKLQEAFDAQKPIVALCIAPALLAKVLTAPITLTLGTDDGLAEAATTLGAQHTKAIEAEVVVDEEHKIVSTPCYLFDDATPKEIAVSADKAVAALLAML